ncbi:MAG: Asp23/Gls24 family envelope stress response protein [Clostridia bacterium]|nr:Asp23/Gls24 family envelope stress response protein [Clostridia bacterium]
MGKNNSAKLIRSVLDSLLKEPIEGIDGVHQVKEIKGILKKNNPEITCEIYLTVDFGVKIPEVSWNVQTLVKSILKPIDDMKVGTINIHIIGVELKEENND